MEKRHNRNHAVSENTIYCFWDASLGVVSFILARKKLIQNLFQCSGFFFGQCSKHGFISTVEKPVTAFGHQIRQTACGEFGTAMTMTVVLSFVMTVGVTRIGGGFPIKVGLSLTTL